MTVVHTIITIIAVVAVIKWIKWKVAAITTAYILEKRCIEPSDEEIRECTQIVIRRSLEELLKTKR